MPRMPTETAAFEPYREPLRTTLLRTGLIAAVVGVLLAGRMGGLRHWPAATLIALWPALGGHFVELFFLNWLRRRLPVSRGVQILARLLVWFVGGVILALGMYVTAIAVIGPRPMRWPVLLIAGVAFIGIELIPHLFLQLRGRPSFYNGRG
jgi:hypothetical protein